MGDMNGQQRLVPTIGWLTGGALAVGSVLGSGVLVLPSILAQDAGPSSIIAWIFMTLLSFPIAMTLGTMATYFPHAGGIANFAREAFGITWGRITGWLFLGTVPLGAPVVALVGAYYMGSIFRLADWQMTVLAASMLYLSVILNYLGIQLAAWVQVWNVGLIGVLLVIAILASLPHVQLNNFVPFVPHGWLPIGQATVEIFWAFVGWEMVVHLAEEFKNPKKTIMISLLLADIIVGLLYITLAYVTIGTKAYQGVNSLTPLMSLLTISFGKMAANITAILAFLITFGAIHTNIAGFSRMVYAQGRSGDFPKIFAVLHPKYKTPHAALIGLAIVFTVDLMVHMGMQLPIGTMMMWPSIVFLSLYLIAMSAAIKLLPKNNLGRTMAMISLILCVIIYPFSGWIGMFPILLAGVGWIISKNTK